MQQYEVKDLQSTRQFLSKYDKDVILTNPAGSTRYYGIMVLDYIFKALRAEFPQVRDVVINTNDDFAAEYTAKKLGYKVI